MRTRSFLRGLPIVLFAPLLAAPRGCHFGSDDVPLGTNPDAGEGGEGGSAGNGTGGSGPTGGSGNAGSSGGNISDLPCLEELTPISGSEPTPLGFSEVDVQDLLAGNRRTTLATRNTAATNVTLEFAGPFRVYYVESVPNPDFGLDIVVDCQNHVRAIGTARFASDDGVFEETLPDLEIRVGSASPAGSPPELVAGGSRTLKLAELRGTYYPPIPDTQCLWGLQFGFDFTEDEFSGLIIENIVYAPCGTTDPDTAVAGSELGAWRCQGETCRTGPNDTVVVEADGCEGLGMQVSHAGDEAHFEFTNGVLTREVVWDCGCPTRAKSIMTYTLGSPLELRLCTDPSADMCEGICSGPLSYDLSRALALSGTNDFRFAD